MTDARFRFSADILQRLGEELTPSLHQAIVELVKNSYDADATTCEIRLESVTDPGGSFEVIDNGNGMTVSEIEDHFLLLGKSPKTEARLTPKGRMPAGSKGLGRLAALRAGRYASLVSRSQLEPDIEHHLTIDWVDFENIDAVGEVLLSIDTRRRGSSEDDGTTLVVSGLSKKLTRRDVKNLAKSMILLADPFGDDAVSFRPTLQSPEFNDLSELVSRKYFADAEYHLHVSSDERGYAHATLTDWRGEALFSGTHADIRRSSSDNGPEVPYRCPPTEFSLWMFLLDGGRFRIRTTSPVGQVREWLREFGGVMLYRNGIRVSPYGDHGNDWLDMNLRRVQSPEERPSTNNSLGRVRVQDTGGVLLAKTDRTGFIESVAFSDLRQLARDGLDWAARERLAVAESRRTRERQATSDESTSSRDRVKGELKEVQEHYPHLLSSFEQYDRDRSREVQTLKNEVQLYRTLGTAGITAATFAHEGTGGPIKIIGRSLASLRRRLASHFGVLGEEFAKPLDLIESSIKSLQSFGNAALSLVNRDKRRTGRVEVHKVLDEIADVYGEFVASRDTTLSFSRSESSPYFRGSVAALESIVINLITNSLNSLVDSSTSQRQILVSTKVSDGKMDLVVDDNGKGITDFDVSEIWLPGITSRPGGSGLGLTIVRDTVADLGGTVSAEASGPMGGARFRIMLPIIGS